MLQDKFINLFTDFGFKKLFGEEPNKDLLISFLNTLLPEKHHIQDLQFTKNEYQGAHALDRKAIFDLSCTSSTGERGELRTLQDKWFYIFRHLHELQEVPPELQEAIFLKLFAVANIAKFSPIERQVYEDSLKYYRDLKNVTDTAEQAGHEKGLEEGLKQGIEQGIEQGIRQVARNMLEAGIPMETIIQATGLSRAELDALI